ncbi:MAG: YqeG family HAD IIIA-type phosphatase [Clostridia bacterium]|nr:YqeG family HAD IIIA-type phosphatase [Clostridia bacterium]
MRKYLCPDYYFDTYREITPAFLLEVGIRYLILDIDNTLAPYEQPEPDEQILGWLAALDAVGIRAAFVSNNKAPRVELFNAKIGIPMFPEGKKPLRRGTVRAMEAMSAIPEQTATLGDQIFTDVWAGRRIGARTILVPPIKDKRDPFTRLKRLLERPIMRYYRKRKERVSK